MMEDIYSYSGQSRSYLLAMMAMVSVQLLRTSTLYRPSWARLVCLQVPA